MELTVCIFLLLAGAYFTVRTRFVQVVRLPEALKKMFPARANGPRGGVTAAEAACTSLAATIGTGNISGVAGAMLLGGPGVVFWMWVSAFFGMATKYAEILFAIRCRRRDGAGNWQGGPMACVTLALPERYGFLAPLYAALAALSALCMGNMIQVNALTEAGLLLIQSVRPGVAPLPAALAIGAVTGAFLLSALSGGAKRVGRVAAFLVPLMGGLYLAASMLVIGGNIAKVPAAFALIVRSAFTPRAALGAAAGVTFRRTLKLGLLRGVFTHEAGLGTAALAHGNAETRDAASHALYGVFEVFVDTILICTVTALVLLVSGIPMTYGTGGAAGAPVVGAFATKLTRPGAAAFVSASLLLFSVSSMLSFALYGETAAAFLFGSGGKRVYRGLIFLVTLLGAAMKLDVAWRIADLINAALALPNLAILFGLSRKQELRLLLMREAQKRG